MHEDSSDVFAEMDALFDQFFSKMSGNFGMTGMGFPSPGILLQEFSEEPDEPAPAEVEEVTEVQFREPVPKCSRIRTERRLSWNSPVSQRIT